MLSQLRAHLARGEISRPQHRHGLCESCDVDAPRELFASSSDASDVAGQGDAFLEERFGGMDAARSGVEAKRREHKRRELAGAIKRRELRL